MAIRTDANSRYTETHEWVRLEGDLAVCGITDYAQEHLSDIVYVELPAEDDEFAKGEVYGVVESVKAASDCYLPVSGTIVEINEELEAEPEVVNADPYGAGWFVKVQLSDPGELDALMDETAYATFAAEQEDDEEE